MKRLYLLLLCFGWMAAVHAQKFSSEKGMITFFSDAAIEDIKAENTLVGSLFNAATGDLVYIVKILDFRFEKSLMREHFNEKYMETEKFPKSIFQGKLTGYTAGNPGQQKVKAVGKLTIHGVTKNVEIPGTVEFAEGKAALKSKFIVKLQDYNVKIPRLVWQNIAEEIEVKVDFIYKAI
jgi:polyisoprenoid-binding protein YceI